MNQDLISVIIPMYKMEKFIAKCLDSVCASSYKNLEILCVDDGSPDGSAKIVNSYAEKDSRIHLVTNPKNLGLFRARVQGMKVATGKYIAFVDADDFVSVDWFRLLHKKIVEENADMVLGNTVNVDEKLNFSYHNNYRSLTASHKTLVGEEVLNTFLEQEGSCYSWHTVWNKLYSKNLIDKCLPYIEKVDFHLIMCEDIAFSSVFYTHAQRLAFSNVDAYFYYRHSEASTSSTLSLEKVLKNIYDIKNVFEFFETSLKAYNKDLYLKNKKHIEAFKEVYHRIWSHYVYKRKYINKASKTALKETFGTDKHIPPIPQDNYFYKLSTPWSSALEDLKVKIKDKNIKVVSFDIFDTLVTRPFYKPTDLFYFVGKLASKILPGINEQNFVDMRMEAERQSRFSVNLNHPSFEDVTLSEIYNEFSTIYNIDKSITKKLQDEEIRLELSFCKTRITAKELFYLAVECGKQVVLTSDMYLEKSTIEELLNKNGYDNYQNLFLSSDKRLLKSTGHLFDLMIKEVGVKPNQIVHVGDNWDSDNIIAKKKKLQPIFIPKTLETFENRISDIYTGNAFNAYLRKQPTINEEALLNDIGIRAMIAQSANKIFDNPFNPINPVSNYNADTYYTGYYTLGMHMFGVASWILQNAKSNGYKKIVFLSRDGYLIKQIFDYINKKTNSNIKTEYFYTSRKALIPYSVNCANDLFGVYEYININLGLHSPLNILQMLEPILKTLTNELKKKYATSGINLEEPITSKQEFFNFINYVIKYSYDEKLCNENKVKIKSFFDKTFPKGTATFDIGYSGRLQSIICDLAGKQVDTFFIHTNGYLSNSLANKKFKIHAFYDFSPIVSSIVREFLISNPEPSCIGYKLVDNKVSPIFEEKTFTYVENYAIKEFQKGALDFCRDFTDLFENYLDELSFRKVEVSYPFDFYLSNTSQFDRLSFDSAIVEDYVYSGYEAENICEIWTSRVYNHTSDVNYVNSTQDSMFDYLSKYSRIKRALFYFIFDRKTFKAKLKNRRLQRKLRKKHK